MEYDGYSWKLVDGYYKRWNNIKRTYVSMHRYIFEKYNGIIKKGMFIHHKDKNPLNNSIENLEMITHSQHSKIHQTGRKYTKEDKIKMSKKAIGNKSHLNHKHTEQTKELIRLKIIKYWKTIS